MALFFSIPRWGLSLPLGLRRWVYAGNSMLFLHHYRCRNRLRSALITILTLYIWVSICINYKLSSYYSLISKSITWSANPKGSPGWTSSCRYTFIIILSLYFLINTTLILVKDNPINSKINPLLYQNIHSLIIVEFKATRGIRYQLITTCNLLITRILYKEDDLIQ